MRTLLIHDTDEPPREVREIVRAGSTDVTEMAQADAGTRQGADRIVVWKNNSVTVDDRCLRWPEDRDELVMLFETGG